MKPVGPTYAAPDKVLPVFGMFERQTYDNLFLSCCICFCFLHGSLHEMLGQGNFAKAYHARNARTGQEVAIKVMEK
jgi:hypothetical protein